jgi:hypothetical protein
MTNSWQFTAVRTVNLGYEQLLILQGGRGPRVKVLFRGQWLGQAIDARTQPRTIEPTP